MTDDRFSYLIGVLGGALGACMVLLAPSVGVAMLVGVALVPWLHDALMRWRQQRMAYRIAMQRRALHAERRVIVMMPERAYIEERDA